MLPYKLRMKIIDELIDDLAKEKCSLTQALTRAKILAHKLKNKELKEWIDGELSGYIDKVPDYRILPCQVIGSIGSRFGRVDATPIPLISLKKEDAEAMRSMEIIQSVASLEAFIKTDSNEMTSPIPPELYGLMSRNYVGGNTVIFAQRVFNRSQIIQIVTVVKSRLLEFLLELNSEIGDIENVEELTDAKVKDIVHNTINFYGDNTNFQQGNSNVQTITVSNIEIGAFDGLKKELSEISMPIEDINELEVIIDNDDPSHDKKEFGVKVKAWISKMLLKAMDGSWSVGLAAAGKVLADGISKYYGWQ